MKPPYYTCGACGLKFKSRALSISAAIAHHNDDCPGRKPKRRKKCKAKP